MSGFSLGEVVKRLQRSEIGHRADQSDSELIQDYLNEQDPFAFERIVRRHGVLVWNVCLRALSSSHDAEEAFQSVFLIAIQKMTSLRNHPSLPGWLHRVTIRVASQVRSQRNRQRLRQKLFAENFLHPTEIKGEDREIASIIDEEVDRLPDRFRKAFILCVLKGLTNEQAAKQLGCPKGTVESRLARARSRLRQRLMDRGIAPAVLGSLAITSTRIPELLARQTISFSSHPTISLIPNLSPSILSLAQGAMQTMAISKMKWTMAVAVSVCLSFTGIGWLSSALYADGEGGPQIQVRRDLPKDPQEAIQFLLQENARLRKELVEVKMKLDEQAALIEFTKKKLASGSSNPNAKPIVVDIAVEKGLKEKLAASDKALGILADKAKLLKTMEFEKDPKRLDELKKGLLKLQGVEAEIIKQKVQGEASDKIKTVLEMLEKAQQNLKTQASDKAKREELLKAKEALEKQLEALKAMEEKARQNKEKPTTGKAVDPLKKRIEIDIANKIKVEEGKKIEVLDKQKIEDLKKQRIEIEIKSEKAKAEKVREEAIKATETKKRKPETDTSERAKAEAERNEAQKKAEMERAAAQKKRELERAKIQLDKAQAELDKLTKELASGQSNKGGSFSKGNSFRFTTSSNKTLKTVILDRDDIISVKADPKDPNAITGKALKAGTVNIELIDVDGKKQTIQVTIKD